MQIFNNDIIGTKYNKLTIISDKYNDNGVKVLCKCDCGSTKTYLLSNIKSGFTTSCGCARKEARSTHGLTSDKNDALKIGTYRSWKNMVDRCTNVNHNRYNRYGGRGIKVCDRWLQSPLNFIEDMGIKPSVDHSIERINNNGNYELRNCRWATKVEQANNKSNNVRVTYNGKIVTAEQIARRINMSQKNVAKRINTGWSVDKIINTPNTAARTITANELTLTIPQWSQKSGIDVKTIYARLEKGWTPEQAVTTPLKDYGRLNYNGHSLSVYEWSRQTSIPARSLYARLEKGWDIEKVLTTPIEQEKTIFHNGLELTIAEWAYETGISENTIRNRIASEWDEVKAISTPVSNDRRLDFNDESLTVAEWSKKTGIPIPTINARLGYGWSIDKVLSTEKNITDRRLNHDGLELTINEWSKKTGISAKIIRERLRDGWSIEKTLNTPARVVNDLICFNDECMNAGQWGSVIGVSQRAMAERKNRNLPIALLLRPIGSRPIKVIDMKTNEEAIFKSPVDYCLKSAMKLSIVYEALNNGSVVGDFKISYLV